VVLAQDAAAAGQGVQILTNESPQKIRSS